MKKHLKSILIFILSVLCITAIALLAGCETGNDDKSGNGSNTELGGNKPNENPPDDEKGEQHKHSYTSAVTNPTCTKAGYTTYTCSCGNNYIDDYVNATGHTPKAAVRENEVAATCITNGGYDEVVRCSACNEKISTTHKTVDSTGHTPKVAVRENEIKATCTANGSYDEVVRCSACNEIISSTPGTIDKVAHNYQNSVCTYCGDIIYNINEFRFELSAEKDSYILTEYLGNAAILYIPEKYQDKPVTSIGERAFRNCSSLTSITISDSVTYIGDEAFYNCSSLTSITIPDSVTSIGAGAFGYCSGLTSVYITDIAAWCGITGLDNLMSYGSGSKTLYLNGEEITELIIPDSVTSIGEGAFLCCSGLTSITIPDSVTSIGYQAFESCSGLTSITIPDSVTSIGYRAFSGCSGLKSITIPDSVTSIGSYAFYYCRGLTSITIPDSVTKIGSSAFYGCSGLKIITIPDSVTSIGDYAFYKCSGLTSITIPDSVTSIGYDAFYYCHRLTSITIPDSVTSIGEGAFMGCSGLTSVTIPDSVTSIGSSAFSGCSSLESISVSELNTTYYSINNCIIEKETKTLILGCKNSILPNDNSVTSIGDYAFYYCSGLTSITIPDSVTSIGSSAFSDCSGLTSITIPDSVTYIGSYAFENCSLLETVYYKGTAEDWEKISIDGNLNATRYYYSETEPELNSAGTAYDGNYWHYDSDNQTPVKWN